MDLQQLVGKIFKIKIEKLIKQYYIANTVIDNEKIEIYIEDTKDFLKEELIQTEQECIVIDIKDNKLIGFIISDRKFLNDMKKIENATKENGEYPLVNDIYLLKKLKIKGRVVGLYLVDEGKIAKYYLDETEIGIYSKKIRESNIIFKENTIENELAKQIKDVVKSIDLSKKEISLELEKQKQKEQFEKVLEIENTRQITRIATIDLKQKIKIEKELGIERNNKIQEKNIENQRIQIKKENTTKDVNIKQELETKDKVTDMETLGKLLKDNDKLPRKDGKEYTKIGIIESEQRDNLLNEKGEKSKTNTTRYSFVAIAKDGSVVPLELEQDHQEGNNPREINYQVNQQGKVKQDDVLSRFKIGDGTFAVKNGEYGEIKAYHSPKKTIGGKDLEGNKSLDRELETDNVWEMKKEERDLAGKYKTGYRGVEKDYQEAKLHEDDAGRIVDNDKVRTKDIDGDINTRSHVHDNVDYNQLAVKWGYYKEGEPNADKAKEIFDEKRKENPEKETKQIVEMVNEELEEEIGHNRDRR